MPPTSVPNKCRSNEKPENLKSKLFPGKFIPKSKDLENRIKVIRNFIKKNYKIKSISHITGGGLIENPPRAFNKNLTLKFDMKNFKLPPLFKWLKDKSNISLFELTKTFNCGIGFCLIANKKNANKIKKIFFIDPGENILICTREKDFL